MRIIMGIVHTMTLWQIYPAKWTPIHVVVTCTYYYHYVHVGVHLAG